MAVLIECDVCGKTSKLDINNDVVSGCILHDKETGKNFYITTEPKDTNWYACTSCWLSVVKRLGGVE